MDLLLHENYHRLLTTFESENRRYSTNLINNESKIDFENFYIII